MRFTLILFSTLLLGQDFYPRMKEGPQTDYPNGAFWLGANQAFVGQDVFMKYVDRRHPMQWQRPHNSATQSLGGDFRDITCNIDTDVFSAKYFQLKNGTALQFRVRTTPILVSQSDGYTGPIKTWDSHRTHWYFVIDSTPAAQYTGQGTFRLALTPGGAAIDATTCTTGNIASYAGWHMQISLDVPQTLHAIANPDTDMITTVNNVGTPISPGIPSSGSGHGIFFTTDGTLPGGLSTFSSGDRSKYCPVYTATTGVFGLRAQSIATACVADYFPPNDLLTARCGVPGDASAACEVIGGGADMPTYVRVKVISVQSGTMPANLIYLDGSTIPWVIGDASGTVLNTLPGQIAGTWRMSAPGGGAVRATWCVSELINCPTFNVTFKVMTNDITSAGTGQLHITKAGTTVWVKNMSQDTGAFDGWPQGTLFSWKLGVETSIFNGLNVVSVTSGADPNNAFRYAALTAGAQEGNLTSYRVTLIAKIPAISPPGKYNVSIKFDQSNGNTTSPDSTNAKTFIVPVFLETLVPLTGSPSAADYTPLPGLSIWEDMMTNSDNYGGRFGTTQTASGNVGADNRRCVGSRSSVAQVAADIGNIGFTSINARCWFYGCDHHFTKISDYLRTVKKTPDELYKNCAEYIANDMSFTDYRPDIGPYGYFYFMRGIYIMSGQAKTTNKYLHKDVIRHQGAESIISRGDNNDFNMRETSLEVERRTEKYMIDGKPDADLEAHVNTMIGTRVMWGDPQKYPSRAFAQPFMIGIGDRSLIYYYANYHADPRIPVVIKRYVDRIVANNWYNTTTHQMIYNPEPAGMRCGNRCQEEIESHENNFTAPSFYVVWRATGNNFYRDYGDAMFSNYTSTRLPESGKEWSQTYYFGWVGVCLRTGNCSLTDPQY